MKRRESQSCLLSSIAVPDGTSRPAHGAFLFLASFGDDGAVPLPQDTRVSVYTVVPLYPRAKGQCAQFPLFPKCRFVKIISWNHGLLSILLSGIATGSRIEMCSHQKWQLGKEVVTARLDAGVSRSLCVLSCFPSHPCSSPRICPDGNVPAARRATGIVCLGLICHGASECW